MRILLHTCCSLCTIAPWRELTGDGHGVTGFFYNPNVHPFIEFRRRLKSLKLLQERLGFDAIFDEDYGLRLFLDEVDWHGPTRCAGCYRLRLGRTAAVAREKGFDAISTTLLASTHQDTELIRRIGEECAAREGRAFVARDWRSAAEQSRAEASKMNLYVQQYCGCVFSEFERYRDTKVHLYRGGEER